MPRVDGGERWWTFPIRAVASILPLFSDVPPVSAAASTAVARKRSARPIVRSLEQVSTALYSHHVPSDSLFVLALWEAVDPRHALMPTAAMPAAMLGCGVMALVAAVAAHPLAVRAVTVAGVGRIGGAGAIRVEAVVTLLQNKKILLEIHGSVRHGLNGRKRRSKLGGGGWRWEAREAVLWSGAMGRAR